MALPDEWEDLLEPFLQGPTPTRLEAQNEISNLIHRELGRTNPCWPDFTNIIIRMFELLHAHANPTP